MGIVETESLQLYVQLLTKAKCRKATRVSVSHRKTKHIVRQLWTENAPGICTYLLQQRLSNICASSL